MRQWYCLVTYLLASAKDVALDARYGSVRLLEACSRLIEILDDQGASSSFLSRMKEEVDRNKAMVLTDEKAFVALVDEWIERAVGEMGED